MSAPDLPRRADVDDTGVPLAPGVDASGVRRVVSLVPSLTESLATTAPGVLVGATSWCTHPGDLAVTRVGGTKSPDVARVVALRPDLVLANAEENRPEDLDALRAEGVAVWTTAPRTLDQALWSLARVLGVCGLPDPGWLDDARRAWSSTVDGTRPTRRAFVPVWRRPWVALGADTFAADVLARLDVAVVPAGGTAPDERYPRVEPDDVRRAGVDLVVLPDEPYAFRPDRDLQVFAGWGVPVALVSGRHLTWYGPSLVEARDLLEAQLAAAVVPGAPVGDGRTSR